MTGKLTKKQRVFVKDYIATGNGTQAALAAYDTDDPHTAHSIASENLRKPAVAEAIDNALSKESLEAKHQELLHMKRIDYFVFPKWMEDDEIIAHVEDATGITILNIKESEKGKFAFYVIADAITQARALDLAYKLRGDYAPTKSLNVNVEVEADATVKELTKKLNELHGGPSISSDGGKSRTVGTETQDKK